MNIIDRYAVNHLTSLIKGEHYMYGHLYTRVIEGDKTFLVRMTPLEVLEYTLTSVGSDLKGATKSARIILGKGYMTPIIVNAYQEVCMFPTHSPKSEHCIWFNPKNIINIEENGRNTKVILNYHFTILVEVNIKSIKNKRYDGFSLLDSTKQNGIKVRDISTNEKTKQYPIIREKSGKYNFDVFKKKDDNEDNK
ncbi:competence protein ComK [Cytobacillus gottheilii]|uniref:competence protein ComK n=1 Tax=Cytobacillus gottheilii TaxID=859144 RepID=UPI003CFABDB1